MTDGPTDDRGSAADGVRALAQRHRSGEASVVETVRATLARIDRADPAHESLSAVLRESALERATELDGALRSGVDPGRLAGVPFVAKANLCLTGVETHCGSRMLAGWSAPYTATALERALAEGAIPVGVAQMDEFGMGSSGEHSTRGIARNPWSAAHTPGGSSSGAAAAVGARLVPFALGSDTGGSVRQPAAFCGVTGFKPTYGRVSRFGLVAYGSSLDCVAPLAISADDCALVFEVISGGDARDGTALALEPWYPEPHAAADLTGLAIGVPSEYVDAAEPAVTAALERGLAELQALGARIIPCHLPHTRHALSAYYVIATAEASANLARFDGLRFGRRSEVPGGNLEATVRASRTAGLGDEVRRRILLGTFALSSGYHEAWYERALRVRRLVSDDFERAFESVDLIAAPTAPTPAFRLGERAHDPLAMYAADVLTVPASLAGLPAISLPLERVAAADGAGPALPAGLQLIGRALADGQVLRAGALFQMRTAHHRERPPGAERAESRADLPARGARAGGGA